MKEKRKEVSCNVIFDIINYLFVLTYLNFELQELEELSENSEEEDETQPPHGNEKSGANVNEDEGEESSDDEEYSHSRFLLETRDRVLGRGRLED